MEFPASHRLEFSEELASLQHDVLAMGSMAEAMVAQAVDSLVRLDSDLAQQVIERDDEVDALDVAIEQRCLKLLLLQQPTSRDLRMVGTAIKMITDVERVGDLAVDVAKCGLKIGKEFGSADYVDVPRMATAARGMLRQSLEAFVHEDLSLAEGVWALDNEVDNLYRELRDQIHKHMRAHPEHDVAASWLLLAIHHIERIADHAVNIAERVYFMLTGTLKSHSHE